MSTHACITETKHRTWSSKGCALRLRRAKIAIVYNRATYSALRRMLAALNIVGQFSVVHCIGSTAITDVFNGARSVHTIDATALFVYPPFSRSLSVNLTLRRYAYDMYIVLRTFCFNCTYIVKYMYVALRAYLTSCVTHRFFEAP